MKKNRILLISVLLIIIIGLYFLLIFKNQDKKEQDTKNDVFINTFEEIDKNQTSYKEDVTVEELKEENGLNGDKEIYKIEEEYDGRKILTVKADLKFKVAFCGMIERKLPNMEELDSVLSEKFPQKNGIWVEDNSRDNILYLINNSERIKSKYAIDKEGYLYIVEKNQQTGLDQKLENTINSDKLNILTRSSLCYIIDTVTGEILDYNFEKMDKYQAYVYFEDNKNKVVFITENSGNQLHDADILEDMVNLLAKGL